MKGDHVDQWIGVLGRLLSPAFPAEAIKPLTESFAPLLRREFQPNAFSAETALKVAEAKRYGSLPSWDIVAGTLREHVRENRPITYGILPAYREPDWPQPTAEQIAEVEKLSAEYRDWRATQQNAAAADRPKLRDVTLRGEHLRIAREEARSMLPR